MRGNELTGEERAGDGNTEEEEKIASSPRSMSMRALTGSIGRTFTYTILVVIQQDYSVYHF